MNMENGEKGAIMNCSETESNKQMDCLQDMNSGAERETVKQDSGTQDGTIGNDEIDGADSAAVANMESTSEEKTAAPSEPDGIVAVSSTDSVNLKTDVEQETSESEIDKEKGSAKKEDVASELAGENDAKLDVTEGVVTESAGENDVQGARLDVTKDVVTEIPGEKEVQGARLDVTKDVVTESTGENDVEGARLDVKESAEDIEMTEVDQAATTDTEQETSRSNIENEFSVTDEGETFMGVVEGNEAHIAGVKHVAEVEKETSMNVESEIEVRKPDDQVVARKQEGPDVAGTESVAALTVEKDVIVTESENEMVVTEIERESAVTQDEEKLMFTDVGLEVIVTGEGEETVVAHVEEVIITEAEKGGYGEETVVTKVEDMVVTEAGTPGSMEQIEEDVVTVTEKEELPVLVEEDRDVVVTEAVKGTIITDIERAEIGSILAESEGDVVTEITKESHFTVEDKAEVVVTEAEKEAVTDVGVNEEIVTAVREDLGDIQIEKETVTEPEPDAAVTCVGETTSIEVQKDTVLSVVEKEVTVARVEKAASLVEVIEEDVDVVIEREDGTLEVEGELDSRQLEHHEGVMEKAPGNLGTEGVSETGFAHGERGREDRELAGGCGAGNQKVIKDRTLCLQDGDCDLKQVKRSQDNPTEADKSTVINENSKKQHRTIHEGTKGSESTTDVVRVVTNNIVPSLETVHEESADSRRRRLLTEDLDEGDENEDINKNIPKEASDSEEENTEPEVRHGVIMRKKKNVAKTNENRNVIEVGVKDCARKKFPQLFGKHITDAYLQQKIDYEIKMRDGTAKLLAASKHPHQMLEAAKNLLTSNSRMIAYMSELQKRKTEEVLQKRRAEDGNQLPCKARVSVSDIRIPLMWRDTDHFKNRGDHRRYAVFCVWKIGTEIYDTTLLKDVDRSMTDVTFDDVIVFNDIPHDFVCSVEIYCHKLYEDLTIASTPRRLKKKFNELSTSVGRSVGKRLSGMKDETEFMANMLVGPKFEKIAEGTLRVPEISDSIATYDLTLINGNNSESSAVELPLFGHFCCRFAAQPYCLEQETVKGHLELKMTLEDEIIWQRYYCVLKNLAVTCWMSEGDVDDNSPPCLTIPITKDCQISHATPTSNKDHQHAFHIATSSRRYNTKSYVLSADSEQEFSAWWDGLQQHMLDQALWQHVCDKKMEIMMASPQKLPNFMRRGARPVSLYDATTYKAEKAEDSPMSKILARLHVDDDTTTNGVSKRSSVANNESRQSIISDTKRSSVCDSKGSRSSTCESKDSRSSTCESKGSRSSTYESKSSSNSESGKISSEDEEDSKRSSFRSTASSCSAASGSVASCSEASSTPGTPPLVIKECVRTNSRIETDV